MFLVMEEWNFDSRGEEKVFQIILQLYNYFCTIMIDYVCALRNRVMFRQAVFQKT